MRACQIASCSYLNNPVFAVEPVGQFAIQNGSNLRRVRCGAEVISDTIEGNVKALVAARDTTHKLVDGLAGFHDEHTRCDHTAEDCPPAAAT